MNQAEKWLPVVGWERIYEVSDFGRVRRVRSGRKVMKDRGRVGYILAHVGGANGYAAVHLSDGPQRATPLVHLLVTRAFIGPVPAGKQVNHKNGNRMDPVLSNLEYVTQAENNLHAYRVNGRAPVCIKGEAAGRAKLTDVDVHNIRNRYAKGGISQTKLADEFGVHQTMIGFIVRRANWDHI